MSLAAPESNGGTKLSDTMGCEWGAATGINKTAFYKYVIDFSKNLFITSAGCLSRP